MFAHRSQAADRRALSCGSAQTPLILDVVNNVENLYSIGTIQEEMQAAITYYRYLGGGDIVQERFEIIDEVRECRQLFARLEDSLSVPWEHNVCVLPGGFYPEHSTPRTVPKHYKTPEGISGGLAANPAPCAHSGVRSGYADRGTGSVGWTGIGTWYWMLHNK